MMASKRQGVIYHRHPDNYLDFDKSSATSEYNNKFNGKSSDLELGENIKPQM